MDDKFYLEKMPRKDHPIPFQDDMVRAILEGRKITTRRVIRRQPAYHSSLGYFVFVRGRESNDPSAWFSKTTVKEELLKSCPYGIPGDHLWVREAWKIASFMEGDPMRFQYRADMGEADENEHYNEMTYEQWFERVNVQSTDYLMKTHWPDKDEDGVYHWEQGESPLPWRPSIFMPRWVSRITLEILSVRVERVQEITEEDAAFEGCQALHVVYDHGPSYRDTFKELWDSINKKRGFGFDTNCWVWVIEFKKL